MLISPAYAQAADAAAQPGLLQSMLPLVLIFGVFYFLLIRPQQKKMKRHKEMLGSIRRGDRIVTGGGILARVTKIVGEGELVVEIADGVKVRVDRGLVSSVIAKPEAADVAVKPKGADNDDDQDAAEQDDDSDDGASQDKPDSGLKKLLKD